MKWKRLCRALLFPPIAVLIALAVAAAALMTVTALYFDSGSVFAIAAYAVAAYALTVWAVRLPRLVRDIKNFKRDNKYARRWFGDARLRMNVTLFGSLSWNAVYSLFQLWLGIVNGSFWFYALAVYYLSLATMRAFLMLHVRAYRPGERMYSELRRYRACGWIFLVMNLALSVMVFFMVYRNRTFDHGEVVTIAMATYTFGTFTTAIINIVRNRRYGSPVYSASGAIRLAAGGVSMLTLEATMLTTFGDAADMLMRRTLLGISGAAVVIFIVIMAVYMIAHGTAELRLLEEENENGK